MTNHRESYRGFSQTSKIFFLKIVSGRTDETSVHPDAEEHQTMLAQIGAEPGLTWKSFFCLLDSNLKGKESEKVKLLFQPDVTFTIFRHEKYE